MMDLMGEFQAQIGFSQEMQSVDLTKRVQPGRFEMCCKILMLGLVQSKIDVNSKFKPIVMEAVISKDAPVFPVLIPNIEDFGLTSEITPQK